MLAASWRRRASDAPRSTLDRPCLNSNGFTRVPNSLLVDARFRALRPLHRDVLIALLAFRNHKTGEAFPGQRTLAELLGCGLSTVRVATQELEERGVVERRVYDQRPVRIEYVLTEKGRDLREVLEAISRWADRWETTEAVATAEIKEGA